MTNANASTQMLPERFLGTIGREVSAICIGTSPLASTPATYGYEVPEPRALETLRAFLDSSLNFLDTSNNYGSGRSERAIGKVLAERGGLPEGVVLATKVDADPVTREFSGDRVRRSVAESCERLGLDQFDLLHLHDPDLVMDFATAMRPGGAVETLQKLKEEGRATNIGIATGDLAALDLYLGAGVFDVMLSHNQYTLIDRTASRLIDACNARRVSFLNAAPYGGGMLAKGPKQSPKYAYTQAGEPVTSLVVELQRLCEDQGVPLAAAALQFSVKDPRITSTVVGVSSPQRIAQTLALASHPISLALWADIEDVCARSPVMAN